LFVASRACPAVDAGLAVSRFLALDGRLQRPRLDTPLERPRVPGLDGRHPERTGRAGVELLRCLGHRPMLTARPVEWPGEFYALKRGEGCAMCNQGRPEETQWGVRIFAGEVSDAYLQKAAIQRGYSIVIWRGRHVAEPTELAADEARA